MLSQRKIFKSLLFLTYFPDVPISEPHIFHAGPIWPPADYFVAAAKNRGFGSEQTEREEILEENAIKYAEAAKQGAKFPALNLDFTTGDQEGRHRARMAEILKLPYVPVFIFDFYKEPDN